MRPLSWKSARPSPSLWLAAAFIAPQLLLIFTFFYWPSGEALYWAVTLEPPCGGERMGRLAQFRHHPFRPEYWNSVRVSLIFAAAATAISLAIALLLALFVDRGLAGHQVYQFTFFLPYALAAPALGLAFRFILSPEAGFIVGDQPDLARPVESGARRLSTR